MIPNSHEPIVKYETRPKPQKLNGYIYSPPAWRVCEECGGAGLSYEYDGMKDIVVTCKTCDGTGRIPIYYNIEQWQEAGGVLSDDTPVMYRWKELKRWHCDFMGAVPSKDHPEMIIIIATEAGRPPEGYTP